MAIEFLLSLGTTGSLAALAARHDDAGARTAYQDFFALWKDADPDIPVLKEAPAEYVKLQKQQFPVFRFFQSLVCKMLEAGRGPSTPQKVHFMNFLLRSG